MIHGQDDEAEFQNRRRAGSRSRRRACSDVQARSEWTRRLVKVPKPLVRNSLPKSPRMKIAT